MNWYLFAAYSLTMAVILGYVAGLHGKLHKLLRELEYVKNDMGEDL